jgi:Ca2+-binding EF-hand superfamily protein
VILSFQQDLSVTERQAIFRRFDADGTGDIDVNEFCRTLDSANGSALVAVEAKVCALGDRFRRNGQTVADAFCAFDRNFDGLLTRDEWVRAMRTFAWDLSDTESDAIFRRFDVNGDGYMNIAEFDTFFKDAIARCGNVYSQGTGSMGPSYQTTPSTYGVLPVYVAPAAEEPWEIEVLDTVRSCLGVGRSGMTITEVFRRLDYDHSQTMSPIEFQRMVTAYRPDLTAAHVDSLFRKVNTSNTGQIVLSEFIRRFG